MRYLSILLCLLGFPLATEAQFLVEYGPTWNKATIRNPSHYQSKPGWGPGKQLGFWFAFDHGRPNRLRIGVMLNQKETYFRRRYPQYTLENLTADVTRQENTVTFAALLEQRLIRFNPFEWTVSGALGAEFPGTSSYQARVQPGGAMPGGSQGGSLFPTIKATVQFRTGVLYHPTPRLSVGLEAIYGTHVSLIFTRIGDKYVPQTLGLNLKANYYIGRLRIPEAKREN